MPVLPDEPAVERAFEVENLCRHFSQLSPHAMLVVEGENHIVRYVNSAFTTLAGNSWAEMVGCPFADAVPEGVMNGCGDLLDRVLHTGSPEILEDQEHSHIPPAYWSYSVWPVMGLENVPVGVMIQVTDTTELAIFRAQVVEMNQKLLVSASLQHELTKTAEDANQIKDQFLATVSHELRTPLTVIVGWAGVMSSSLLDPELVSRGVEVILRNARMQALLIDDLLDASRIIMGQLRLNAQPLELGTIILTAVEGMRPAAAAKSINLRLELDAVSGQVLGDPNRLQQVVWNLVSNAIKFTPVGGLVSVQLTQQGAQLVLTVKDTGKGISAAFLPHVFDRFRQADATSTRAYTGLGLGLAIVRQLVELHGGTVAVESEGEGRGSSFCIRLPVLAHDAAKIVAPSPLKEVEEEAQQVLAGLQILVVDDEPDTTDLLQVILQRVGATVQTAHSVAAAMEASRHQDFDVVLTDIGMPDEDGYTLLPSIRSQASEQGRKVPAMAALTAYVGEEDRMRVLQAGFQFHVPKPISPRELIAAVVNLAGRAS